MTYNLIQDVRPSVLKLSEHDNFLEAFPLIDVYLLVVLEPMRTTSDRDMKHCYVMR